VRLCPPRVWPNNRVEEPEFQIERRLLPNRARRCPVLEPDPLFGELLTGDFWSAQLCLVLIRAPTMPVENPPTPNAHRRGDSAHQGVSWPDRGRKESDFFPESERTSRGKRTHALKFK
jgi:hypothetical protein